jgi:glucan phosphoethanolaminetransferase (alkaline phosphatase superfamily)
MRWSDLVAFFTSAMWFGCNVAFAIVPAVMFSQVSDKYQIIDVTKAEVGELFGQVALRWGTLSLVLLVVLALARISGWIIRLRRRDFRRVSLVGVLLFAAIAVFAGLAAWSYTTVEEHRAALDDLDEDSPERPLAAAAFDIEHQRSVRLSQILTALLLAQSVVLAVSLARRTGGPAPASAAPVAA